MTALAHLSPPLPPVGGGKRPPLTGGPFAAGAQP